MSLFPFSEEKKPAWSFFTHIKLLSAPQVPTTIAFRGTNWHISMKLKASALNLPLIVKLQLLFRKEQGLAYTRTSLLFLALLISITKGYFISFTSKPCLERSYWKWSRSNYLLSEHTLNPYILLRVFFMILKQLS